MSGIGIPGALRERDFRLLFGAQVSSLLGDAVVPVALAFAVLELTGSATDLGLVLAARTLPLVGLLLVGGVVADRLPRRALMVGADLVRFVGQGTLAALLIGGHARLWELILVQALHGGASAFFNPALVGLTPATVSAQRLQQANALRGMAMAASQVVGPAISGALVVSVGAGWALAIDACSFALSAALLSLQRPVAQAPIPAQSLLADLRGGWAEFSSRTWIWVVVAASSLGNALGAVFYVLGPLVSARSLGGAKAWALILAAMGLGALLGGLATMRLRPRRPLWLGMLLLLPWGAPLLLLALRLPAVVTACAALAAGFGSMTFNALWETSLQRHLPAAVISRVSAYDWLGSFAVQPLAFATVGPVAAGIGVNPTLYGAAALMTATTLAAAAVRSVRELGPGPEAETAPPALPGPDVRFPA